MKLLIALSTITVTLLVATSTASAHHQHHQSYIRRGLLCIHHYEGSWTDPNAPYWGGLQMDLSFQETYGWLRTGPHKRHKWYFINRWGTADHWPVWAQMLAGIHGYFSRGWSPWPNTARACGLL